MTEKTMTPGEVLAGLQEFVPYVQKHSAARKGYVVGMRRKNKRDEIDEVQTYLCAASVRTAVAALIARNAELEADNKALRETVGLFADDAQRLDWMHADMANGDEGVGIYWCDAGFVFPRLDSGAGGSGGGVYVAFFGTLREAIDAARAEADHG